MAYPANKPAHSTKRTLTALAFAPVSLILLLHRVSPKSFRIKHARVSKTSYSETQDTETAECTIKDVPAIPNIVHFVPLVELSLHPAFEFAFRQFAAISSA